MAAPLVGWVVRKWARGDPATILRRGRRILGSASPRFLNRLYSHDLDISPVDAGPVRGEWIIPQAPRGRPAHKGENEKPVVLYLHGGGYVSCSPETHRPITTSLARIAGCRLFCLDYRLAPEHKFPAAVDDAAAAFRWLVSSGVPPARIALAGDSAGGGLAVAVLLRLRRQGHPLPGVAALMAPWVDLTGSFCYRNADSSPMCEPSKLSAFAEMYLGGLPAKLPEASPVFADLRGLPPLLIQASDAELLLDDAVRLHERAAGAGVHSTLRIYRQLPHVWTMFAGILPEAGEALDEAAGFVSAAIDNDGGDYRSLQDSAPF